MNKEQQKKHIIDMMEKDQELGLYDIFNDEKRQGVKDMIDTHKQDDENYLDSFGVTKTQFEVYRNFNKQETLEEVAERLYGLADKYFKNRIGFIEGAKWQAERMYSEKDMMDYSNYRLLIKKALSPKEWFEQFKNK